MSRVINPWQFINPYISYTPILAAEMNDKLTGISVSLKLVTDEINNYTPRLPLNFAGSNVIQEGPYHNTLLGISPEGNMELIDRTAFALASGKEFTVEPFSGQQITVTGDDHAMFYDMGYSGEEESINVIVGEAIAIVDGDPAVAIGSVVFFTQNSDTPLIFVGQPGVTIRAPGLLRAYGRNSTVALLAVSQYEWILMGDADPGEVLLDYHVAAELPIDQLVLTLYLGGTPAENGGGVDGGEIVTGKTVTWSWELYRTSDDALIGSGDSVEGDSSEFQTGTMLIDDGQGYYGTAIAVYGGLTIQTPFNFLPF
jgi:hypothetical protein